MEAINRAILSHETPDIGRYLKEISSDNDEYVNKLGEAISILVKNKASTVTVDSVLSQWDLAEHDIDNSFICAAEYFVCTNEELRYIAQTASLSEMRYMINQIMDNVSFGQVMNRLLYAYEDRITNDDLLDLKEHLDIYESKTMKKLPAVMNYIERNMKINAKKPEWVSIREGENKSHLETVSLGLDLEQKDTFLDQMREESQKLNLNEDIENYIKEFSKNISDVVDKDTSYDKSFRVWGPENRFEDRDCCGNPGGKGPCRMFTCLCRDAEENDGEVMNDWFTGKCDNCNRTIRDMSHAVRYPHRIGGWKGCYCSFYCISQLPPYQTNKEDNVRLKQVQQKMREIGIMDRSLM